MFDHLIETLIREKELVTLGSLLILGVGFYFKISLQRTLTYIALFFCASTTGLLAIGDGGTEIPAAAIIASSSEIGYWSLIALTVGIKCAAVASGFYHCTWPEELARGFLFLVYSVLLSTVGQGTIFADGDVQKENIKAQIATYVDQRDELLYGKYGLKASPSCGAVRWCKSEDLRNKVDDLNSKIAALRSKDKVTTSDALAPVATMLSHLPFISLTTDALLFWLNTLRTFTATYALMFMSHLTAQCYYSLTGQSPKKSGKRGQKRGKRRAKAGQGIFRAFFGRNRGRSARNLSDDDYVLVLDAHCRRAKIRPGQANREDAQEAFRRHQGIGLNNQRATRILKLYKEAVNQQSLTA